MKRVGFRSLRNQERTFHMGRDLAVKGEGRKIMLEPHEKRSRDRGKSHGGNAGKA